MPHVKLSAKQEAFCLAIVEHGNATKAYRDNYDSSGTENTQNRAANGLMNNAKVIARIKELRAPAVKAVQITLLEHLIELKQLRDLAKASEKYAAAINAEVARGKASGLYVEKIEHSGNIGIAEAIISARSRVVE